MTLPDMVSWCNHGSGGGTSLFMKASDRVAVRVASILSIVLAVWGLAFVAFPFGAVGGAVAAAFGLVFGVLALVSHAWGRWRKTATAQAGSDRPA